MELDVIKNKIYEIRGCRVMLDRDLAQMYGVETKRLNEAVRRNIERFPEDFMFALSMEECKKLDISLRSQFATSNRGGNRYSVLAFTEQGVAMLSSVLRSKIAIQINISIMRAFVALKHMAVDYNEHNQVFSSINEKMSRLQEDMEELRKEMNDFSEDVGDEIDDIYLALSQLAAKHKESVKCNQESRQRIGYKK